MLRGLLIIFPAPRLAAANRLPGCIPAARGTHGPQKKAAQTCSSLQPLAFTKTRPCRRKLNSTEPLSAIFPPAFSTAVLTSVADLPRHSAEARLRVRTVISKHGARMPTSPCNNEAAHIRS